MQESSKNGTGKSGAARCRSEVTGSSTQEGCKLSTEGVRGQQIASGLEANGRKQEKLDSKRKLGGIKALITDKGYLDLQWLTKEILSFDEFEDFDEVYKALGQFSRLLRDNGLKVPEWMEILEKTVSTYMSFLHGYGPVEQAIGKLLDFKEQVRRRVENPGKVG
jgi:phosphate/sulfate permease